MKDPNTNMKSPHILTTSANMLGLCLIVLTGLKISNYQEASVIDEITGISALLFMMSSLFSFLSIRSKLQLNSDRFENFADWIFLLAMLCLCAIIIFITFSVF